jgi:hypothetical protein
MKNTIPKLLRRLTLFLSVLGVLIYSEDSFAQKKKKKDTPSSTTVTPPARPQNGPPATGPKPYKEVITAKAKSKEGLFKVHQIENKFFYEIPDSLLGRDMLMVTTIAKTAEGIG